MLPLTLIQGEIVNNLGGIGMHPEAHVSKDRYDDVTTPRFTQYLETNFYHPEFFWPKFARDIVPATEEYIWTASIESNGEGPVALTWDANALVGAQSNLFLYDEAEGILVDMKVQSSFMISAGSRKDLKIVYTHKGEFIPDRTMLGKPWPNRYRSERTGNLSWKWRSLPGGSGSV